MANTTNIQPAPQPARRGLPLDDIPGMYEGTTAFVNLAYEAWVSHGMDREVLLTTGGIDAIDLANHLGQAHVLLTGSPGYDIPVFKLNRMMDGGLYQLGALPPAITTNNNGDDGNDNGGYLAPVIPIGI